MSTFNRYRVMVSRSGYQTAICYNHSLVTQRQIYFRIPEFDMSQLMYVSVFSQNFEEKEAIVPSKIASVVTKLPLGDSLISRPFMMRSLRLPLPLSPPTCPLRIHHLLQSMVLLQRDASAAVVGPLATTNVPALSSLAQQWLQLPAPPPIAKTQLREVLPALR